MVKIKRILLTTDLSENSFCAKGYACALAEQFDAELHVLSVVPDLPVRAAAPFVAPHLESERAAAKEGILQVIDSEWAKDKAVICEVRQGVPNEEIIRYADENAIDLIVMATHGRTGLGHVLIGSVAERVIRKATCPVLTVHPTEQLTDAE